MPSDTPRETGRIATQADSGDFSGISEMFGLAAGHGDEATGAVSATNGEPATVDRWIAATEGTVSGSGDASGRLVHGRYRLIAELGAGGMGVTYRAWDTQAGVPVVIKMPKREVRHDQEVMTRFSREIEAMRAVPHPSIVPITDSGDDSGCPFVAMRFLPGGSLADYRRRDESDRPIKNPPGMLFFWLPGVAAALDLIHARGMLHRDVKPGNIFLDGFLKPYLGDFGIAKVVDESGGLNKEQTLTATKMAVGTPEYMSPELFKPNVQLDGRVDQYALAVTVYEMLCGEKPFTGSTAHIIVEHCSLPVPPLERRCPGLPRSVYDAVHKALSKNPEERFATCGEFVKSALRDLQPLAPEADTARLLCPSCKNILKLPSRAAGRSGRCPRCQASMDVAADLGSLWLESEERGGGLSAAETTAQPLLPNASSVSSVDPAARTKLSKNAIAGANELLLLQYLRPREAVCPVCDHLLHALTSSRCPNCGHALRIDVVAENSPERIWAALAGVVWAQAGLGVVATLLVLRDGGLYVPSFTERLAVDWYILMAPAAVAILALRRPFIRLPTSVQWCIAAGVITVSHVMAFGSIMNLFLN